MKDIRVEVKLKNNLLVKLREERGVSQVELAKATKISQSLISAYELLSTLPTDGRTGKIKKTAQSILDYFYVDFDEVWTAGILAVKKNKRVIEFDSNLYLTGEVERLALPNPEESVIQEEISTMLKKDIEKTLNRLGERSQRIIISYFGLSESPIKTLLEISKEEKISKERVRQIIKRSFLLLNRYNLTKRLKQHYYK